MAKKTVKKVDFKKVEKMAVKGNIQELFEGLGYMVNDGKEIYGFTDGTLVVEMDKCDIQIKLIAPKAGIDRYEKLEEEEEEILEEDGNEEEDGNSQEEPLKEETGETQEVPKEEEIPNEEGVPENGNEEEIIQ